MQKNNERVMTMGRYDNLLKTCESIRRYLNNAAVSSDKDDRETALINATNSSEYLTIHMRNEARFITGMKAYNEALRAPTTVAEAAGYGVDKTEEGWFRLVLPPLIRRNQKRNSDALRGTVYALLRSYQDSLYPDREAMLRRLTNQVVIFKHVDPAKMKMDYDNLEKKIVLDVINTFLLRDDTMDDIDIFECGIHGETVKEPILVVYITPRDRLVEWVKNYKYLPEHKLNTV